MTRRFGPTDRGGAPPIAREAVMAGHPERRRIRVRSAKSWWGGPAHGPLALRAVRLAAVPERGLDDATARFCEAARFQRSHAHVLGREILALLQSPHADAAFRMLGDLHLLRPLSARCFGALARGQGLPEDARLGREVGDVLDVLARDILTPSGVTPDLVVPVKYAAWLTTLTRLGADGLAGGPAAGPAGGVAGAVPRAAPRGGPRATPRATPRTGTETSDGWQPGELRDYARAAERAIWRLTPAPETGFRAALMAVGYWRGRHAVLHAHRGLAEVIDECLDTLGRVKGGGAAALLLAEPTIRGTDRERAAATQAVVAALGARRPEATRSAELFAAP